MESYKSIQSINGRRVSSLNQLDFSKIDPGHDTSLRDYQIENKRRVYEAWETMRSVMLQMPTGTGKTRLFASIARDIFDYGVSINKTFKVLILAHRKELIEQISDHIGQKYSLVHGLIIAQNIEQKRYSMQVGSVPTLCHRLDRWRDKNFDVIIIDEAHHVKAKSYKKIIDLFPNAKILGVTATPYRLNHAGFRPEFDDLIVSPSVSEFIRHGYLCEYDYYSIRPNSVLQKEIDTMKLDFEGDYKESEMMGVMDRDYIRADILNSYVRYAGGKKAIIYTINKEHSLHLAEKFNTAGIVSAAIDSETPRNKRDELVNRFREGEIQVLFNVNIFSEGFDCPDVEVIQLARPTKSLSMYLQQVGRGLRPADGKEKLIILDNVGLYNKFGFPSARRKWRYHFEGLEVDESPSSHRREQYDEYREAKDIFEGNEEVTKLHSSIDEEVSFSALEHYESVSKEYKNNTELDSQNETIKKEFENYLAKKGFRPMIINHYMDIISVDIDGIIRRITNSSFNSLFSTTDMVAVKSIISKIKEENIYKLLNVRKNNALERVLQRYLRFLEEYYPKSYVHPTEFVNSVNTKPSKESSEGSRNREAVSSDEIDKRIEDLESLKGLLKKNNIPVTEEISEKQRQLKLQDDLQLLMPIELYLEDNKLKSSIVFKYMESIKDVDVLSPKIIPPSKDEIEDMEKIVSLMTRNGLSIPKDVQDRHRLLNQQKEAYRNIRNFENWLVGYMTYLRLPNLTIESISYSPSSGFIIKYEGRNAVAINRHDLEIASRGIDGTKKDNIDSVSKDNQTAEQDLSSMRMEDRIRIRTKQALEQRKEQIELYGGFYSKSGRWITKLGAEKGRDMSPAWKEAQKVIANKKNAWRDTSVGYKWVIEQVKAGIPRKTIIEEFNKRHETNPFDYSTPKGAALSKGTLSRWISEESNEKDKG